MSEQKREGEPRVEITPTGIRVEYWKNDHGGEDVVIKLPQIKSGSKTEPFVKKQERG